MRTPLRRKRRASIVITMVFALALAAVGASFLTLTTAARRGAESNYNLHATQSVLERGVDEAMYAFGKYREGGFSSFPAGWTSTSVVGRGYSRDMGEFPLGNGRNANLKVTIQNVPSVAGGLEEPFIVAEAYYAGSGVLSAPFSRQVVVKLKTASVTGGGQGLVSKNKLTFKGNGSLIDSYTSWPLFANGTPAVNADGTPDYTHGKVYLYGAGIDPSSKIYNRTDRVTVASAAYNTEDFDPLTATAGGEIFGFVLIGGGDETQLDKAVSGIWVHGATSTNKSGVDTSRTATGYSADFTAPSLPKDFSAGSALPVPESTTVTTGTGNNKVTTTTPGTMTGKSGATPTYYTSSGVRLTDELVVKGNVVLVMTGDFSISGNGKITIDNSDPSSPSSLTIYTAKAVDITGNGIVNAGAGGAESTMTSKFTLNGTNTDKNNLQSIKIAGNGAFSGMINAPFADFTMGGGGNAGTFFGAVKAFNITINGGGLFHYDTALSSAQANEYVYPVEYWVEPKTKVSMKRFGI